MSGKKQTYQNSTLELLLGVTPSANRWLALYTVAPTATTAGTEVADPAYARQPVTFTSASAGSTSNSAALDFGAPSGGSVTVVAFAVCDAVSAGNQIYWGTLTNFTAPIGVGIHVNAGACTITES